MGIAICKKHKYVHTCVVFSFINAAFALNAAFILCMLLLCMIYQIWSIMVRRATIQYHSTKEEEKKGESWLS